jgi:hypothetical protein
MSALPNPLKAVPGSSKQPKLNRYGRDPKSIAETCRRSTNYEKGTGYAPYFHAFLADWGRISSGHICDMMLMVVLGKSLGRGYVGKQREEETLPITYTETAQLVAPTEWPKVLRSVEREYARWQAVGIAEVRKTAPGTVVVKLLYRNWESLPDYHSNVVEITTAEEAEPETTESEQKPGHQRLTPKPVTIPAGSMSKPIPVSCGVKSFQWRTEGPVDLTFTAVIQAGELVVVSKVPDDWLAKVQKRAAASNETNNVACGNGRGRPKFTTDTKAAGELAAIFDPLLKRSQSRLLSADSIALATACAEYHGLSKADLLHFLMGGSDPRAGRPISSPKSCIAIIKEARLNWERSGSVPDVSLPSGSGKKKGFAESVIQEAERRLKKYGRI